MNYESFSRKLQLAILDMEEKYNGIRQGTSSDIK